VLFRSPQNPKTPNLGTLNKKIIINNCGIDMNSKLQ
jgi:hypothetical protein